MKSLQALFQLQQKLAIEIKRTPCTCESKWEWKLSQGCVGNFTAKKTKQEIRFRFSIGASKDKESICRTVLNSVFQNQPGRKENQIKQL